MQKVQIIHHRSTQSFSRRPGKGSDNITPEQRLERLRDSAPEVCQGQEQRGEDEHRALAEIVGNRDPEEVEDAQDQDWPGKERRRLTLRLVEFLTQDVEGGGEAADGIVGHESEGADAGEADVFFPSRPSERVIRVVWIGCGMEDQLAVVACRV